MNKLNIKKTLAYVGVILFFLVVAYSFVPQVLSGKIVNQGDIHGYAGMAHEMNTWNEAHPDDQTSWTNSMFGGMPTTVITAPKTGDYTQYLYDCLLLGKRPATYLFISMVGAFLLLLAFGCGMIPAIGAAIAMTFCSYNLQIIQVGHNTKMQAIAFLPWVLAAFVYAFRTALAGKKKWFHCTALASVLFAFAVSFQVKANHQQITYYLGIMLVIYALSLLFKLMKDKADGALYKRFFITSAMLLVMGLAGIATNTNKLYPIYKYTAQSMRGGSELKSASNSESGGLTIDYATSWSYSVEELPNLLIPNFNGGSSSGTINKNHSAVYELLKYIGASNPEEMIQGLPLYWGPQPFTAGPMYMGAVTIFLFILGLFLCKGKEKWWILVCTILAIFLSLGSNMLWFTELFHKYAPFYNKFRTVSMSLVVLQITLPLLGFIVLDKVMKGDVPSADFKKSAWISLGITAGFCLVFAAMPGLAGRFYSASDLNQPEIYIQALQLDRAYLMVMDALRSLAFIVASFLILYWSFYVPKKAEESLAEGSELSLSRKKTAVVLICFLTLFDLFPVGKRYLNSSDFVTSSQFEKIHERRYVDEVILEDKDPSYRVLDLSVNPFNSYISSYWHKSIGGYNPAKLQRYQELIDYYLNSEIEELSNMPEEIETIEELEACLPALPVLSALNTRYIIVDPDYEPMVNHNAYGNAWFVNTIQTVKTPQDAIQSLGTVDLKDVAILEPSDAQAFLDAGNKFGVPEPVSDSAQIELISYAPNQLVYRYNSEEPVLAVFSEVYYPEGWHAWLDGDKENDVPVFRSDWILRSAVLPAGEHELVMRFDSPVIMKSTAVSRVFSILLFILLIVTSVSLVRKKEVDN